MRNKAILPILGLLCFFVACRRMGGTEIIINESGSSFNLRAKFPRNKTTRVARYINKYIGPSQHIAFENGSVDASTTLNDNTHFRLRSRQGKLEIRFDKSANSEESYERMKLFYKGFEQILTDKVY